MPLRILALGKVPNEAVDADISSLTDHRPYLAPQVGIQPGWQSGPTRPPASICWPTSIGRRMKWLPATGMWLTGLTLAPPHPP